MHLENQFLQNIYIHPKKDKVFMYHNKVVISGENSITDHYVSQTKLLIDLDKGAKMSMLKLYSESFTDLKLIKYQLCHESN